MQLYDIPHTWFFWIQFALLMVVIQINMIQPHYITNGLRTLMAPVGRRYEDMNHDIRIPILKTIFIVGTLALTSITLVSMNGINTLALRGTQWWILLAATLVVVLVKCSIDRCLNYIFQFGSQMQEYRQYRDIIWQVFGIVLLVYVALSPTLSVVLVWLIPVVIASVYLCILAWKLLSTLGLSVSHIFYLLIYLLHAEVLPWLVLVAGHYYLITLTN